ncbi:MAG: hypothetical protein AAFN18_24450 [Cyanobacteria bacterium J06554_6]
MTLTTKKLFIAGVTFLSTVVPLLGTATPSEAFFRRSCQDVYLRVQNETGDSIRVIDLDYWDPSSEIWRSEPVSNETIPDGEPWQEERNLEQVDQMNIKVRVEYRIPDGDDGWSDEIHEEESASAVCNRNSSYTITLE